MIVVENLVYPAQLSPLDVAAACEGRPTVMHDPPWQRAHFAHITELPIDDPVARHVNSPASSLVRHPRHGSTTATGVSAGGGMDVRAELSIENDEIVLYIPSGHFPQGRWRSRGSDRGDVLAVGPG